MIYIEQRFTTRSDDNGYDIVHKWVRWPESFTTREDAIAKLSHCCQSYQYRVVDGDEVLALDWIDDPNNADYCIPVLA